MPGSKHNCNFAQTKYLSDRFYNIFLALLAYQVIQ